jgi:uncharacterized membrane protein
MEGATRILVLYPNCSMSWRENCWLIAVLGGFTLVFALSWAILGAWVILPFAGIEVAALAAVLYHVSWKQHFRQVVRIAEASLSVEEGHKFPQRRWQLDRSRAALAIESGQHPWDASRVTLYDQRQQVVLGDFLARRECEELVASLQAAGLRVGTESVPRVRTF